MVRNDISVGGRLKDAREALGYTQKGVAEAVGSKLRSWQDYEADRKMPGSQVIAGLVRLGVNANWVLTGEGPMLMTQESLAPVDRDTRLDLDLLELVVTATRRQLMLRRIKLEPHIEGKVIRTLYHHFATANSAKPDDSTVSNIIELAAFREG